VADDDNPARGGAPGGGGGGRGQNPARDQPNQPAAIGTASIAGVVTLTGSATPVRRAQVSLSGGGLRGQRTTATNEQGRFSFAALPAGRFSLNVSKPGYVSVAYGAKKPGRQGTPIQLVDGQALTNANVSLPKGSVITGVVVDELGDPSPNTPVRAYRFASQSGQRTLQSAGQGQTDDRGIYRIFQMQPGDYLVSAVPRNQNGGGDFAQQIQSQLQPLLQQVQAAGGIGAIAAGAGGGAAFGGLAGGRGQQLLDQVQQLQQQLGQQTEQAQAYAPVYYPGTASPAQAGRISLGVGEERSGVDFQLQLVPTAKVSGRIVSSDAALPPGAQISLQLAGSQDVPSVPGLGSSMTRIAPDGTFSFQSVTPGQYTLLVRAPVRQTDPNAAQDAQAAQNRGQGPAAAIGRGFGGPGGRGPAGPITQVLWASTDVTVDGRDLADLTLNLQPGMTVSGRVAFSGAASPPADLSTVRVNLRPLDAQAFGGGPQAFQADTSGNFTITGVVPGRYAIGANVNAGAGRGAAGAGSAPAVTTVQATASWSLKSAAVNGLDALDFPMDVKPNETISGVLLTFTDSAQELSGTLQDSMGRPTADYTIILFPADNRYWTPQSRRILSARPGTDGTFAFRGFPAGQYRLTAVTDAEPGEWYDPAFLSQVVSASMTLTIAEGEKKVQDMRLAGGG
jgi:hypothetical protein